MCVDTGWGFYVCKVCDAGAFRTLSPLTTALRCVTIKATVKLRTLRSLHLSQCAFAGLRPIRNRDTADGMF